MRRRSTSGPSLTLRTWTLRIASRPLMSGRSTTTWRSKRPGRSRAASSVSGRLVAAMMMTPRLESKPSISTSSWLSVCSRSSWPPTAAPPRVLPRASSSSMKMMHGARALGLGEQVADAGGADADEHFDEIGAAEAEERHVGLAGDRLGQQRLAGAGRADEQHALGNAAAERLVLLRRLEEIDDLAQLGDGLVDAGHVLEGDLRGLSGRRACAWLRPKVSGEAPVIQRTSSSRATPAASSMTIGSIITAIALAAAALPPRPATGRRPSRGAGGRAPGRLPGRALGAEGDGLRVDGVGPAVEDGVVQDDFAAHVGVADLHVAHADAGVAAAGFEDLNEFAIFKSCIRCFSDEKPVQADADGHDGEDGPRGRRSARNGRGGCLFCAWHDAPRGETTLSL